MIDAAGDQAAGLRALLSRSLPEVLAIVPCGAMAMRWVARQARQRAAIGQRVLAFDEHQISGNLADCLGVAPRFDLLQAVQGQVELEYCLAEVACAAHESGHRGDLDTGSLNVLSIATLAREMDDSRILRQRTAGSLTRLQGMSDEWLLLAQPSDVSGLSGFARAAPRLLLVVDPVERAITEAYAALKRLVRSADILAVGVCVAGAEDARARLMATRLRQVAATQLGIDVQAVASVGEAIGMAIPATTETAFTERLLDQAVGVQRPRAGHARAFI